MNMPDGNTALLNQYEHAQAEGARDYEERAPQIIEDIANEIIDGFRVGGTKREDFQNISDDDVDTLLFGTEIQRMDTVQRLSLAIRQSIRDWLRNTNDGQNLVEERMRDE